MGEDLGGAAQPGGGVQVSGRSVVVIGGGLAGISAALDCASADVSVILVDVRPRLGGAVYSFERDGLWLDNGQHVFLRCCDAYRDLLARTPGKAVLDARPSTCEPATRRWPLRLLCFGWACSTELMPATSATPESRCSACTATPRCEPCEHKGSMSGSAGGHR